MSTKEMATTIVETMSRLGKYLCFAESCTAGGVPKIITSVPGASKMFLGGLTAYAPKAIASAIGVGVRELEENIGLVSEEATRRLSEVGLERLGGDLCIATTGYLGPFDQDDRPDHHEGWVVVRTRSGVLTEKVQLEGRREANRQLMLRTAFGLVLNILRETDLRLD